MKSLLFFPFLFLGSQLLAQEAEPQNLKTQPLLFLENKGQVLDFDGNARPDVLFLMRGSGVKVFVGKGELHYLFTSPVQKAQQPEGKVGLDVAENETDPQKFLDPEYARDTAPTLYETYRIDISLQGMNPNATVEALDKNEYYENYYNIPGHYRDGILNVRSFGKVLVKNVYPNIDWILYSKDGKLKHEFLLHPGANVAQIRLQVAGATELLVNEEGELVVTTPLGTIVEDKPFIPEDPTLNGSFVAKKTGELLYEIGYWLDGIFEIRSELTIDPGVIWSTFYGGESDDHARFLGSDSFGNILAGGGTYSLTGISQNGYQNSIGAKFYRDAFLVKFGPDMRRLWATYFGGAYHDEGMTMSVSKVGNIFMAGQTSSPSGIAYKGFDSTYSHTAGRFQDMFLAYFEPSGKRKWSTYYGGLGDNDAPFTSRFTDDRIYLGGASNSSSGIATSNGYQKTYPGYISGFISAFDTNCSIIWGTYFGGSLPVNCFDLQVDDKENVYFCGATYGTVPILNAFQSTFGGGIDCFIGKLNINCQLIWSTYLGGTEFDFGTKINLIPNSNKIWIGGHSLGGSNFPLKNAFQSTHGGNYDAFIVEMDTNCNLIYSSFLGNSNEEILKSMIFFSGKRYGIITSNEGLFKGISKNGIFDSRIGFDIKHTFFALFDSANKLIYSTYYYGKVIPGTSARSALHEFEDDDFYLLSVTDTTARTLRSPYNSVHAGEVDAFLMKWSVENFMRPYITNKSVVCQGSKLGIVSLQYAVGRGKNAQTKIELSDSNGVFNGNTKLLHTRTDTFSQYDSITWSIPQNFPPGKNYRIRCIMSNPADTSELSLPIEIHRSPTGKILPVTSNQICDNDSLKMEVDTLGNNKLRWYYKSNPTPSPGDTTRFFVAKKAGTHYALLSNKVGCTYATNSLSVIVWPQPSAGFIAPFTTSCFTGNTFNYTDTSKAAAGDAINKFQWYFGDGNTSTQTSPTFHYSAPGTYTVKLGIGTNTGCRDTAYQTIHIWPSPVVKIHTATDVQCLLGNSFVFTDSTKIAGDSITKWDWKLGTGTIGSLPNLTRSFSSTGNWTIDLSVETSRGCTSDTSKAVKVSSSPNAEIQASNPIVCSGDSVKLEVTNPNIWNYQWYESGNKIINETRTEWHTKAGGTYSVRATTNDGCDTVSNEIKVIAFTSPVPNLGEDKYIKHDSAITLNPGVFQSYLWKNGAITNSVIWNKSNLDTGDNTIWVKVTDSNGCKGSDTVLVRMDPLNSLAKNLFGDVRVYPVPVHDKLYIESDFDVIANATTYRLYTAKGEIVAQGNLVAPITEIDMGQIASGVYVLRIQNHRSQINWKVVR